MTKLKEFADDKLNVAKMTIALFDRVENTMGNPAFSPFTTVCSKAFILQVVKRIEW